MGCEEECCLIEVLQSHAARELGTVMAKILDGVERGRLKSFKAPGTAQCGVTPRKT